MSSSLIVTQVCFSREWPSGVISPTCATSKRAADKSCWGWNLWELRVSGTSQFSPPVQRAAASEGLHLLPALHKQEWKQEEKSFLAHSHISHSFHTLTLYPHSQHHTNPQCRREKWQRWINLKCRQQQSQQILSLQLTQGHNLNKQVMKERRWIGCHTYEVREE